MVLLLTARTLASLYTGGLLAETGLQFRTVRNILHSQNEIDFVKVLFAYKKETIQGSKTRSRVTLEELLFILVLVQGNQTHFARDKTYPRSFPVKMELKK